MTPERLRRLADELSERHRPGRVRALLQAGSGLTVEVPGWEATETVPFAEIVPFPVRSLEGHCGTLTIWRRGEESILVSNGRFHLYQGYTAAEVVAPVRIAALLGAEVLLATNATGALDPSVEPGSVVVLTDHIDLQRRNPLEGEWAAAFGEQFPDMSAAYDPELRTIAVDAARAAGFRVHEGVYVAVIGPSFETPAEVRMISAFGGTVVGMSTVPEVIAARHMGMRVAVVSFAANAAAGISPTPLSHAEVLEAGRTAADGMVRLIGGFVERAFPAGAR